MDDARDDFVADVQRYVAAGEELAAAIADFNAMNRAALEDIAIGVPVSESFRIRDSAGWSRRITGLLDEFEACRRVTRASAAAALVDEGRSVTDIGRAFGVSNQVASRFAKGAGRYGDRSVGITPD